MARVSSQFPDDPPAKPNVLAVLVRYRFAFATRCSKCSRCSSLPARRLRALLLALPNAFSVRKWGLPHTSLGSKQNRGPLYRPASAQPVPHRYAPHRCPYPVPSLPNLLLSSPKPPSAAASRPTKRITLAAHVWHCVSALFRFSILRCARFCQHFYSFVVVPALFRFVRNHHLFAHACMQAADSEVTLVQEHDGLGADARLATRISSDLTRTFTIVRLTRTIAHCFRVDPQLPT